jgi:hypothetical protein
MTAKGDVFPEKREAAVMKTQMLHESDETRHPFAVISTWQHRRNISADNANCVARQRLIRVKKIQHLRNQWLLTTHHHHSEHGQGLGLKTCSFEAQGVPGPSIFLSVFPYPAIPEVGTGKPATVGGFYPFVPGGLPICSDTVWCPPLCCPLSNCYGSQGFSGGPILWVLIVVSEISSF